MTPTSAAARTACEVASSRRGKKVGSAGFCGSAFGVGSSGGRRDRSAMEDGKMLCQMEGRPRRSLVASCTHWQGPCCSRRVRCTGRGLGGQEWPDELLLSIAYDLVISPTYTDLLHRTASCSPDLPAQSCSRRKRLLRPKLREAALQRVAP